MLFKESDAELVRSAMSGDRAAFADLLQPEYRMALRLAYGLLQDIDEAEDAVQEAAFSAWKRIGNLRLGASLRPWFLGIVANQCRTVKRSRWWSVTKAEPLEGAAPELDLASSIDLRRALRRIGHDERLILVLRYYEGHDTPEIAEIIGIPVGTVRSRLHHAHRAMRAALEADARETAIGGQPA